MAPTERVGGFDIPKLGLGTLGNLRDDARILVEAALAEGFRHIDTSEYYGNEEPVGQGLARSAVPRDDVWVTTKVLHPKAPPPSDVRSAAEASLRRLDLDYVDLLLIHWPNPLFDLHDTLEVLTALRHEGKARTIGVSNFPVALLREASGYADHIVTNQLEYHPYLDQSVLLADLRALGMVLTAHSPLARGRVNEDPIIAAIARDRGFTPAQVALRWLVQQEGVLAIPGGRPTELEHLRDNLAVLEISLSEEEMAKISALSDERLRIVDPPHGPTWDA